MSRKRCDYAVIHVPIQKFGLRLDNCTQCNDLFLVGCLFLLLCAFYLRINSHFS